MLAQINISSHDKSILHKLNYRLLEININEQVIIPFNVAVQALINRYKTKSNTRQTLEHPLQLAYNRTNRSITEIII